MVEIRALDDIPIPTEPTRPRVAPRSASEWLRENLFSSPLNGLATILAVLFLAWALPPLVRWLFIDAAWSGADRTVCAPPEVGACWAFVKAKFGQFIYGRYPLDQRWRVDEDIGAVACLPSRGIHRIYRGNVGFRLGG